MENTAERDVWNFPRVLIAVEPDDPQDAEVATHVAAAKVLAYVAEQFDNFKFARLAMVVRRIEEVLLERGCDVKRVVRNRW